MKLFNILDSVLRTAMALMWSAFCCTYALCTILIRPKAAKFVLSGIGSNLWSKNMLRIAGNKHITITFDNPQAAFDRWPKTAIFIANHSSQLDINASAAAIPYPIVYLSKASVRKVPILGLLNERVGTVFIDRSNPGAAKKSVGRLLETLNRGISVIVYPEGTRSKDGGLLPFKKGAFHLATKSQTPVIPLHIHGTRTALPKGGFLVRPNPVHVRFGAPLLPPKDDEPRSLQAFVAEGQGAVERMQNWHAQNIQTPD
jgi:1-acyl-sn-glycerol-3-phosphate acyltransferase